MKVRMADLLRVRKPLLSMLDQPAPVKMSWEFGRLWNAVADYYENFDNAHMMLLSKYGDKSDDSNVIEVSEERKEHFEKDLGELLNMEVDIEFEPIPVNILRECTNDIHMTPLDMSMFMPFIDD